jgi:PQ loop repeat
MPVIQFHVENCNPDFTYSVCILAILLNYTGNIAWLFALVPQITQNQHRRSVGGLSFISNFLGLMFSIFHFLSFFWSPIPVFMMLTAVAVMAQQSIIMMQFYYFHSASNTEKALFAMSLAVVAIPIIFALAIILKSNLQLLAAVIWAGQYIDQVVEDLLNDSRGQSNLSVTLNLVHGSLRVLALLLMQDTTGGFIIICHHITVMLMYFNAATIVLYHEGISGRLGEWLFIILLVGASASAVGLTLRMGVYCFILEFCLCMIVWLPKLRWWPACTRYMAEVRRRLCLDIL